jgi:DNA-binding Lrp family transcriptional regulator
LPFAPPAALLRAPQPKLRFGVSLGTAANGGMRSPASGRGKDCVQRSNRRVFFTRSGIHFARKRYIGFKHEASETTAMVPFFVQFKCKLGQSYAVANALAEAEIASEIYSTAGDYDLLVKFYVDNDTDIGHFVNEKVQVIPGIQDTHTIITFKAFGTG